MQQGLCPSLPPVGVVRVGPSARVAAGLRQGRDFPHLPPNLTVANMDGAAVPLAGLWGRVSSCWELLESPGHAGWVPTDAVVVSVARSPSNGEWPLQIPERPAGAERGGRARAELNKGLLGKLPAPWGPRCSEFQAFCSLVFPVPPICPAAHVGCGGATSAHPAPN